MAPVYRLWVILLALPILLTIQSAQSYAQTRIGSNENSINGGPSSHKASQYEGITKEQADAILLELHKIRELLESNVVRKQPSGSALDQKQVVLTPTDDWIEMGREDAPVTVVEFTDLECPFCRRFQSETFPKLKSEYIDSGKIRFISLDLPLPIHPYAVKAAEATRCAAEQGKFWQFREGLLNLQEPPTERTVFLTAHEEGLSMDQFKSCLDSDKYEDLVQKEQSLAASLQIGATPTFVVGHMGKGQFEGKVLVGARDFSLFQSRIAEVSNVSLVQGIAR